MLSRKLLPYLMMSLCFFKKLSFLDRLLINIDLTLCMRLMTRVLSRRGLTPSLSLKSHLLIIKLSVLYTLH